MADPRKRLHREVMAQLRDEQPGALLDTTIPMAADVERMGSRRRPLADFAPRSPAARAYAALWEEIQARLE
jgi:cellulose biosynthesis protein BcsQ